MGVVVELAWSEGSGFGSLQWDYGIGRYYLSPEPYADISLQALLPFVIRLILCATLRLGRDDNTFPWLGWVALYVRGASLFFWGAQVIVTKSSWQPVLSGRARR